MTSQDPLEGCLVAHLSQLAHLTLPAKRKAALERKLQALVEAFASLDAAEFDGIPHDASDPICAPDELRSDVAEPPPTAAEVLKNAPQLAADSFVVPRVVEH